MTPPSARALVSSDAHRVTGRLVAPEREPSVGELASAESAGASTFDDPEITLVLPMRRFESVSTAPHRFPAGIRAVAGRPAPRTQPALRVTGLSRHGASRSSVPLALRIGVLSLAGVLAIEVGWLTAIHLQPMLARQLENRGAAPVEAIPTQASSRLEVSASGMGYVVPAASYSLGFDISNPCWIVVRRRGTGATIFAATLQPADAGRVVTVSGDTSVEIAARAIAITVRDGSKTLATIANPAVGVTYDFTSRPTSTTSDNTPS